MSEDELTPSGPTSHPEPAGGSTPQPDSTGDAPGQQFSKGTVDDRRGARLPWPPPGFEWIQGALWKVTTLAWLGSVVLVSPLIWSLATPQEFWSLGPLEDNWALGLTVSLLGAATLFVAFFFLQSLVRAGGRAADLGYGFLTIVEVATDLRRDQGFLLMGKRHFSRFSDEDRARLTKLRLTAAVLILSGALWLAVGFSLSVLMAARELLTQRGIWIVTLGPTLVLLLLGGVLHGYQFIRVRLALSAWRQTEGGVDRIRQEVVDWTTELEEAGDQVVMGAGSLGRGRGFRGEAFVVVLLFIVAIVPTLTVSMAGSVGPVLAEIAIPQFLSVQEMAGAAEALRRYRVDPDPSISPSEAGHAMNNVAFVGSAGPRPESLEQPPATHYATPWFPTPDFPDIFSEGVGRDLVLQIGQGFSGDELDALRQAADHPAQNDLSLVARAEGIDMVSTRWITPFPDSLTVFTLPFPHFTEVRYAALARAAKAVLEQIDGRPAQAEASIQEIISTGFLLVDHGPTLIDNLVGVVVANIGGDALEGLYEVQNRDDDLETLRWARESSTNAARAARLGLTEEDIHTILRGIPNIVENESALRGLRWEYLATFNMLAPCINLQKMVFGPDVTYQGWLDRVEASLVREPGDRALFDLAKSGAFGVSREPGMLTRLMTATLGTQTRPGSCVNLIASLESGEAF